MSLDHNIRWYPRFEALWSCYFWLPIFFLYFREQMTIERVLQLEAIYYASVVLLETPSGYFSDRVGRRLTLIIASVAQVVAAGLFFVGGSFWIFVAAQFMNALGISFHSGTDASFHYDSLESLGRDEEFAVREAMVSRNKFFAGAAGAILGGLVAMVELRYAYALTVVSTIGCVGIAVSFVEPRNADERTRDGYVRQMAVCMAYLRRPALRWLFGFALLMIVLNHIPYEFYQPYIDLLAGESSLPDRATPALAGLHTGLTMLAASWIAARSIRIARRIGTARTLMAAVALQVILIGLMGFILHPVIAIALLLRSCPRGLMTAPLNAAIAPRIARSRRATYFSMQSLAGRLSFSLTLLGLSLLAAGRDDNTWDALTIMLQASMAVGIIGGAILLLTAKQLDAD